MHVRFGISFVAVALICSSGCQRGPKGIVRDPVHKVTGQLLIDGKAEQQIAVKCNPVGEPKQKDGTSAALTKSAFTDADGKFAIGTYESGDGAPDGEYVLTFQWGAISLANATYTGDKFKGKYSDPKKSEVKLSVQGKPVDLGVIELTTK